MLLPIKPTIDRRPRRNGTSVISIQYCYSSVSTPFLKQSDLYFSTFRATLWE
jgi:hypothetical protein